MSTSQDVEWFVKAADQVRLQELAGAQLTSPEPYFVDFLRDPPEPTGEEADDADLEAPKIYEMVSHLAQPLTPLPTSLLLPFAPLRCQVWTLSRRS